MPVCDHCKRHMQSLPKISLYAGVRQADGRANKVYRLIDPHDIVAVQAMDKGHTYYLTDGSNIFDFGVSLSRIRELYPDMFLRVRENWIVRHDMIEGYRIADKSTHFLLLKGLSIPVPVAVRSWAKIRALCEGTGDTVRPIAETEEDSR